MQRTLFDFARRTTVASASPVATVGAGATAAASTPRPRRSPSTSLERSHGEASNTPSRKRVRQQNESAGSDRHHAGLSREDPVDLEESSLSVVAVAEEKREATVSTTTDAPAPRRPSRGNSPPIPASECTTASSSVNDNNHRIVAPPATGSHWLADLISSPEWKSFLQPLTADTWRNGEFARIQRFLDGERAKGKVVLPPAALIFNAFNSCPFAELKVVLLGQDPYHNLNQAHGLCFSVLPGVPVPPSLKNMYKELATDIPGFQAPTHGYLQSWAEQGMLMLNATLTVEAHSANSHSKASGWQHFTDAVIAHLSAHHPNRLVFLLWGSFAQQKKKLIDTRRHVVIESVHPSPLSASRGWFGSHCFSACNTALRAMGHTPMYWQLPLQVQTM
ncbi:putative uracil-DNA-glycosylase [Leptomonas pyrrhocoris]|uniref:Uracil-DNA glycosylase n=1 Tax=Leptomonas pyrrhocoris TaxID=157538 RepID=A0A0N0DU74_LEPPY|nr:putative uracil-DNA-glycosylase [Leptomonas pyrrhocoris]XP_015656956.1 putative uracil-DNA-glycosylase [Leptomonas pyrrhocoris]XP_015656957.1 putative uracil-DNA-glycosylase [Leptomonas pyrrhocoris]KPA78516.1 putative uracil-DNA-glycosylase [Leptomonas pyrrhocoris]KPA78517.1 putative uracil-DNA-glycosylase [Leptomonas pyrrhocoris]KPA78518.1 putative uracil-DNA-glycosylase [Leptomonas pyrrhocoris]|eukprot:XP_015656955.1 putative uracil-DNA-glycosylase [Leptomonas pyrrhocoris]